MRNKLLALAAIIATGGASAQSNVTLYGTVDVGYANVKTNAGRISGMTPSGWNSSKIGFRGVEDLGGGLRAKFSLEAGINPANGAGVSGTSSNNQSTNFPSGGLLFNRQSWVGLEGSFGEVRFGRDYTPTYWNYAVFEPFYNNSVATSASTWAMCIANTCARASNSIGYRLPPNLGGVYGWAMYAFGNRASNETFTGTTPAYAVGQSTENNGRHMSVRLGYSGGPVNTAVAYGKTTYAPGTNTAGPLGIASTPYGSFTDLNGGVTYKLGSVQLLGFANRNVMQDAGALGNDATIKGWNLGAIWGVGSGEIPVSYGRASVSSALLATEPKATKWAIGYRYFLSKRTTAFAYYAHVSNSGGAALTAASFSAGGIGAVGGAANINGRSTGIEVGLDHNF